MKHRRTEDRVLESIDVLAEALPGGHDPAWRDEWLRRWRRFRLPEQLTSFSEELEGACTAGEVYTALTEHTARIVGAYVCLLFLPSPGPFPLRAFRAPRVPRELERIEIPRSELLSRSGLLGAQEACGGDRDLLGLVPLFAETGAACVAHVPFGEGGMLLLVERRRHRVFSDEDWSLLRMLCLQAEAALERVRLSANGTRMSLDPLTGLLTTQQSRDVLQHAWSHAVAGRGLVVGLLHLPELPDVRATFGSGMADHLLRAAVSVLRREAAERGLVVRYGSDECLLLLPGSDRATAAALMERVTLLLEDRVRVRVGIAPYEPAHGSVDELVRDAARACWGFTPGVAEN